MFSRIPLATATTSTNVHPGAVFNTVIHNNREAIPFILASVSLEPEAVHLQMKYTKQDIQDATSD